MSNTLGELRKAALRTSHLLLICQVVFTKKYVTITTVTIAIVTTVTITTVTI